MRLPCLVGLSSALSLATIPARAEPGDAARAFVTGASVFVAGFAAGGVLAGASGANRVQLNAGWLTIEAGYALAPLAAHAASGEWARGLLFATPGTVAWGATLLEFEVDPNTIDHGSIEEQRVVWSFFVGSLLASVAGIIDATLVPRRRATVAVAPMLESGRFGLRLGAAL